MAILWSCSMIVPGGTYLPSTKEVGREWRTLTVDIVEVSWREQRPMSVDNGEEESKRREDNKLLIGALSTKSRDDRVRANSVFRSRGSVAVFVLRAKARV